MTKPENAPSFNALEKERQLKAESDSWDGSAPVEAQQGDIPVIDLHPYFSSGSRDHLTAAADQLRVALEEVGFFTIVGHQVSRARMSHAFDMVKAFHALPEQTKMAIKMDRPEWPVGGVGYLPVKNRKLPARDKGNLNEAFLIKCDHRLGFDDNQWLEESELPGFRETVTSYANALEDLGRRLLPVFAVALDMPEDYFNEAFAKPLYRLRMTRYPPVVDSPEDEYGIAPHVDTTFCTILAQDSPGLTVYSERRHCWIKAPVVEDAFVVNSGELLKIWTNHRFISTRHFVNNNISGHSRYSIPFFLNANSDYQMTCIPSCCDDNNPPRYPPISYNQSQAAVQGE